MAKDLSAEHGSIGALPAAAHIDSDARYRVSDEEVRFFNENGYLQGPRILSDDEAEILRTELDGLIHCDEETRGLFYEYNSNESADPNLTLFHALGAWRVSAAFHDLLWHPAFTVPASQLLNGPVRFWHDQLFVKPAHHGGVVIWHQDYSYWQRTVPMAHLTCWIALDDSNEENGCLRYVPGSHKWNLLPREDFANDMERIREFLTPEQKLAFDPVPMVLKKGECSFHHPLTVHGSYANTSERPRRAAVINVFRDGVMSDSNEPLLEGVPPIPKGTKIDGQFFPLLSAL
jgi:hypothetical protein